MEYKISVVSGSARNGRLTPLAVTYLISVLNNRPEVSEAVVLDVKEYGFPIMEERRGKLQDPPERLDEFGEHLASADALVFASPEYNGSFSGALKNTLDYFYPEYKRKPIGVMTAAAGRFAGVNASHDLQKYILTLGGYPMPQKLLVGGLHNAFDSKGQPKEDQLRSSYEKFVDELIWLTDAVSARKAR